MKRLLLACMAGVVVAALCWLPLIFNIAYGYAGVFGLIILVAAYLAFAGALLKLLWKAVSTSR